MSVSTRALVLVHGSWLGGWVWQEVRAALAGFPAEVTAPTLTGLGEREHLATAKLGLSAHVTDLLGHIDYLDADRVTLVGHSYGGAVATAAAVLRPGLVDHLVVLDGFVLESGEAIFDRYPILEQMFAPLEDRGMIVPPGAEMLGLPETIPQLQRHLSRLRPMSRLTHAEEIQAGADRLTCRRDYLRFTQFPIFADLENTLPAAGWNLERLDVGHMAPLTEPSQLAVHLAKIVAQ